MQTIEKNYIVKALSLFLLLSFGTTAWSQNGYVVQTISGGDTTYLHQGGQIYWKLYQGVKDAIIESTMPPGRTRTNVKYPITAREYDGYFITFDVKKSATESFQIVFHTGDRTVTYIFDERTVIYKGENVKFTLHD
ncbi:MAG: hypothetical protein Crog4KO_34390 [Crocinitomicaceae bacterium]